jgi:hypothetical protein
LHAARQAVQLIEELTAKDTSYCYDQACHLALFSSLLDGKDKQSEESAIAAVDALNKAVAVGYDNTYKLKTDPRLAPLRGRLEFQKVLQSAEANARSAKE